MKRNLIPITLAIVLTGVIYIMDQVSVSLSGLLRWLEYLPMVAAGAVSENIHQPNSVVYYTVYFVLLAILFVSMQELVKLMKRRRRNGGAHTS